MMLVIGVILLVGLLPKISKYVPASSIAGFLFVLGIFKTVALDAPAAFAANAAVGGTAMVVTAVTNPFLGLKEFIVARKSTKSYMRDVVSASVHSITTKGEQHLYLDGTDAEKIRGKNICLIDDVISTGESLHALEILVQNAGAKVVKKAALLAEGDAAERKDIIFLQKLPLFHKVSDGEYE